MYVWQYTETVEALQWAYSVPMFSYLVTKTIASELILNWYGLRGLKHKNIIKLLLYQAVSFHD
jgi:hypothetical protein